MGWHRIKPTNGTAWGLGVDAVRSSLLSINSARTSYTPKMPVCSYCGIHKPSRANVKRHIKQSPKCQNAFLEEIQQYNINTADVDSNEDMFSDCEAEDEPGNAISPSHKANNFTMSLEDDTALPSFSAERQSQQPHVEEVPDEGDRPRGWNQGVDDSRFIESYLDPAGVLIHVNQSSTKFEKILEAEDVSTQWGDFKTEGEWQLAKWLLQNVGHNQIANFLDLPIVRMVVCTSVCY
jgi:hypothetical protein